MLEGRLLGIEISRNGVSLTRVCTKVFWQNKVRMLITHNVTSGYLGVIGKILVIHLGNTDTAYNDIET